MMRRPIILILIGYMIGIIIQYYFNLNIDLIVYTLVLLIILSLFRYIFYKDVKTHIILLSFFVFGALNTAMVNNYGSSIGYFTSNNIELTGVCYNLDIYDNKNYILLAEKIKFKDKTTEINEKVLIQINDYNAEKISLDNKKVVVKGLLKIPEKNRNPNMFNYKLYLKTKGIYTILYTDINSFKIIDENKKINFYSFRNKIKKYIYQNTTDLMPKMGSIILSMAFGDKDILEDGIYEDFKLSGTAHLLAVSGLHFGLFYIFLNTLLVKTKLKEIYRIIILILSIWFFAILVGLTPSAVRASAMITMFILSNILDRRYDLFTSIATICFIIIVINPLYIFNVGFQLSFSAVVSIGLFYRPIYNKLSYLPDYINKLLASTLSAQIGTIPIVAYYFNIFSPMSFVFNMLLIPIVGYVLPLIFIFFILLFINIGLAGVIVPLLKVLIKLLLFTSQMYKYIPGSSFDIISPSISFLIFYYLFLILIYYFNKYKTEFRENKEMIMGLLSLFVIIMSFDYFIYNDLTLTFVDVGQGDCTVIETPKHKKILIDSGRSNDGKFLKDFLLKNQISKVDYIFISHIHDDHIGGISDIIDEIDIGLIFTPNTQYISEDWTIINEKARKKGIEIIKLHSNQIVKIEDDVILRVLHPSKDLLVNTKDDINNNSLVLLLEYKNFRALFTGDIEKEGESDIITRVDKIDIDVLKVAHHGSRSSTTDRFLKNFNPEVAVIQVGKNYFGHPHEEILSKLKEEKIKILRNDLNGAIIIKVYDDRYKVYKTLVI